MYGRELVFLSCKMQYGAEVVMKRGLFNQQLFAWPEAPLTGQAGEIFQPVVGQQYPERSLPRQVLIYRSYQFFQREELAVFGHIQVVFPRLQVVLKKWRVGDNEIILAVKSKGAYIAGKCFQFVFPLAVVDV